MVSDYWRWFNCYGGRPLQLIMKARRVPQRIEAEVLKEAYKEAMKEWLDDQFATFGRYSFYALLSAGLTALMYFILTSNGWHR